MLRRLLLEITVKEKFEQIVQSLLDKHVGGREFFTALDAQLSKSVNRDIVLELVSGLENKDIVVSGKFGKLVYSMFQEGAIKCRNVVYFGGGICTQGKAAYCHTPQHIHNRDFVFVDDSLFSGKTVRTINEYLKKHGSKIRKIIVAYNGSKLQNIESLYSYYGY